MGFPVPAVPQRSPAGISTSPPGYLFGDLPEPTPFRIHERYTDFDTYAAGDWTVTSGSSGTSALTTGNGGLLLQSTAATLNDIQANQTPTTDFLAVLSCRMWFAMNINLNDATAVQFQAGFANTFATLAPTDGIFFNKPTGAAALNLVIAASSVQTVIPVATLANATQTAIGFYYDGKPTPNLYVFCTAGLTLPTAFDGAHWPGGKRVEVSASADGLNPYPLTNIPIGIPLVAGFGLKAGAGAVKTNTVDYFYAGNEIIRF